MAKRDFIHERYGDMFDKFIKPAETRSYAYSKDNTSDILKERDDTTRRLMIKNKFSREYGKLFDTVPGDGFIRIMNQVKALREECIAQDTDASKLALRDLDNYFVEVLRRELLEDTFFYCHDEKGLVLIFGNESLGRKYFENNPHRWSLMDYRWFVYFFDKEWMKIDNYNELEGACGLAFHGKRP